MKVFEGTTVRSLTEFLEAGRVNTNSWLAPEVRTLLEETKSGRCTIGHDESGRAVRVVTSTAVSIYSPCDEKVLLEVFESPVLEAFPEELEDDDFENPLQTNLYTAVRSMMNFSLLKEEDSEEEMEVVEEVDEVLEDRIEEDVPFEDCLYPGILELLEVRFEDEDDVQVEALIGKPQTSVLVQPFSFSKSTPPEVAARTMLSAFNFKDASEGFFDEYIYSTELEEAYEPHEELKTLRIVYTCYLKAEIVSRLKKVVPAEGLSSTNFSGGELFRWWAWVSRVPGSTESVLNELDETFHKNSVLSRIGIADRFDLEEMAAGAIIELENVRNFIAQLL